MQSTLETVAHKIESLTPEQLGQVQQFIGTLQTDDTKPLLAISEPSFAAIWNDPENDVYDAL